MNISKKFKLNKSQYELDFIDIDPRQDIPLFIDPYFLAQRNDPWSIDASRTVRSFFQHLVSLMASGQVEEARETFSHLNEPNETCLGLSEGIPQGRGVGRIDADKIFKSLLQSRAIQTGLAEDLEDCRIFVDGVDKDKISDLTTNIIRKHLIDYTVQQCNLWNIPLAPTMPSGFYWNRHEREWQSSYESMLVVDNKKILLVPKGVTSYRLRYTPQRYHQHFVLNYLQHEHLKLNTALVQRRVRKDGTINAFVTKKDLATKGGAGFSKEFLRKFTEDHPQVFQDFKESTAKLLSSPNNNELGAPGLSKVIDHLIEKLKDTLHGPSTASIYHRLAVGILELIFYPNLTCPQIEREIHNGRKRIDITFDNAATSGFFFRLHTTNQIPAQFIFVECKNYKADPVNPELDQLAGRFSLNRGKFGLLLCRSIDDMNLFLSRCSDTYKDDRGVIIPLIDEDLIELLNAMKAGNDAPVEALLADRFREIALR